MSTTAEPKHVCTSGKQHGTPCYRKLTIRTYWDKTGRMQGAVVCDRCDSLPTWNSYRQAK